MYTILVVDDEKDIVSALEIYLKAEGYRVLTAYNGREALSVAAREDVHLILMDIMMPVMDGQLLPWPSCGRPATSPSYC